MAATDETVLTERQIEVLRLRTEGKTQREVADRFGTTTSNISAVERAAERNVEKARQTLDLVRAIRAPVSERFEAGTPFDELVDRVYDLGDAHDVAISYPRPRLYDHLYHELEANVEDGVLGTAAELGITERGEVRVSPARKEERAQ